MARGDRHDPAAAGLTGPAHDVTARPLTLGTAGHIDHGKTALVTLLTGTNTDRLREERERGISIELGYAQLVLPSGRRLSVVDVPGHERFVRTMVAGATGVDLFLLVVAADDGVMPQTAEHLAILDLLDVPTGVVALTKTDLVDDELLAMAHDEVVAFLEGTRFAGVAVVPVSARDGRGVPDLLGALEEAAARVAARSLAGGARLAVDRVFALKGIGTVATGTLWRGEVRAGDALRVEPGGADVVVRSVEVHESAAQTARAGERVGVNLRGAERSGLARGRWLVSPSPAAAVTTWFDAWIRLLPSARMLRAGERVRLHHGTAQHVARVQLLDRRDLDPGEEAPGVLRLDAEVYAEPGDLFVLRAVSPVETLGGGTVLSMLPVHGRQARAAFLRALRGGTSERAAGQGVAEAVALLFAAGGDRGLTAAELLPTVAAPRAASALGGAVERGEAEKVVLGDAPRYFRQGARERFATALAGALERRATERPDRPALTTAELAAALPDVPVAVVEAVVGEMLAAGAAVRSPEGVVRAGETVDEAREQGARRIAELIAAGGFAPPTLAALIEQTELPRREALTFLGLLVRRGQLVRVKDDLWFARAAVDEARERLLAMLARLPQLSLAEYRDTLGTGRRNAQALLEYFDGEGLTRRVGDARVLRSRRR